MTKRKKPSDVYKTARLMGENVGRLVLESKKTIKTGKKGLRTTAERLEKVQRKAKRKAIITTTETIPQLMKDFRKGLRKGMQKRR
jgi:hypothetical protein